MMKNLFLSIILLLASGVLADEVVTREKNVSAADTEMQAYVHKLMNESLSILNSENISINAKTTKVKQMLSENMDANWMARFTLGRVIKTLSPTEVKDFIATYTTYMIGSYASAVSQYKGEKVEIKAVQNMNAEFSVVKTQVIKNDGNVINVDYLVHEVSGKYKVCDVITEGISLINSQKAEYGSVIASRGVGELIKDLKQRSK